LAVQPGSVGLGARKIIRDCLVGLGPGVGRVDDRHNALGPVWGYNT